MTRRELLLAVPLAVAVVSGCREAPPATSPTPAPKPYSPDEQKAVDAATAFLAKQATNWGSPSKVEHTPGEFLPGFKGDSVYTVTYPTPDDEMKLLGDRVVLVDIKTGRAQFLPRR